MSGHNIAAKSKEEQDKVNATLLPVALRTKNE